MSTRYYCHFENVLALEILRNTLMDQAIAIGHELSVAQAASTAASVAYFALTPYSDNRVAKDASDAYNMAIENEEPIRQRFTAKVAEIDAVKAKLDAVRFPVL